MYLTLLFTLGVPIAIVVYIVKSDRFPEPTNLIVKTFFVGVFLCWPAGFLNSFIFFDFRLMFINKTKNLPEKS